MKRMIKILLILCVVFLSKLVYADTNIKVGETTKIFENASCKITSCTTSDSSVTLSFDENSCSATGKSKGEAKVEIVCDGQTEKKNINIKISDKNDSSSTTIDDDTTLYDNVTSAEVNCSSLGLLRKDLQGIFTLFKIIAPILVVVLSIYDFIKALTGKVEGETKKVFMKLIKRLVFAMILFFLPGVLDFFLGLVDPGYTTCING